MKSVYFYFSVLMKDSTELFFKVKDILFRCSMVSLHTVVFLRLERSRLVCRLYVVTLKTIM